MMASGDRSWTRLVPEGGAVKVIEKIKGEERVRRLAIIENILNE